ncbi:reverse transcriptase domain-containing protein [Tanacetum coccineum]
MFRWSTKAEASFQELKNHLKSLSTVTTPKPEETLTLYLAMANKAISVVLLTERGDFLAELPRTKERVEAKPTGKESGQPTSTASPGWTLFIDGASSTKGSWAGLLLTGPNGQEGTYALRFNFKTSNNEAEYEALIARLELSVHMEAQHLQVFSDYLLITN